jgi:photosystem II stability/assembly factor-like uncharacterized protein
MLMTSSHWLVLAGVCAMVLASPSQAAFQDPLDVPAVQSKLAPRGLINGMAYAGKRMVSVGQRGHILYSNDVGQSWTQAKEATLAVNYRCASMTGRSSERWRAPASGRCPMPTLTKWSPHSHPSILGCQRQLTSRQIEIL